MAIEIKIVLTILIISGELSLKTYKVGAAYEIGEKIKVIITSRCSYDEILVLKIMPRVDQNSSETIKTRSDKSKYHKL